MPNSSDACSTQPSATANGCPAPVGGGGGPTPTVQKSKVTGKSSAGSVKLSKSGGPKLKKHSVDCTGFGPDCKVSTSITARVRVRGKLKTVKLGHGSYTVKAG